METETRSCSIQQKPTGGSTGPLPVSKEICPSLRSDCSRDVPLLFRRGAAASDTQSAESDRSKDPPLWFRTKQSLLPDQQSSQSPDIEQDALNIIFTHLEDKVLNFVKEKLQKFHLLLASQSSSESETLETASDVEEQTTEALLNITVDFLKNMNQLELAERLSSCSSVKVFRDTLKRRLQQRYSQVFEGVAKAGNPASLQKIYTEVNITEGGSSEVNQQHEVGGNTGTACAKAPDCPISCKDIFKQRTDSGQVLRAKLTEEQPIRTVLMKGEAGVGKTILTQKFSLDWAEGKANQDISLLFPFTFRELNVLKDRNLNMVQLLQHFFSQTKGIPSLNDNNVVFILDGLDECRLTLDFRMTRVLTDPTESASVEELLVNLIRGDLLPFARLWITTRPAAASQLPVECISIVTEVQGFTNEQKEQYFKNKFSDELQATAIISHIKTSRILHSMCYNPMFCWILSTVLEHLMKEMISEELPNTLTQMYVHFLVVQAKVKNIKYDDGSGADFHWTSETKEMVWSLGKLAFEQLLKGNLIFYETDINQCRLDAAEIARYSGVFTQVFREETGLYQDKVYCFIHLTVQEFLAALHVHHTFFSLGENLLSPSQSSESPENFYRSAVDLALQSPNGHLNQFLRFLVGLSLPTNQRLLKGLLYCKDNDSTIELTAEYIRQQLNEKDLSTEKSLNLLHCLHELNDSSLEKEIVSANRITRCSSPAHWAALNFLLLSANLEVFDLKQYHRSEYALMKLLPVLNSCTKVLLSDCNLMEDSCVALSSLLSSDSCALRVLDLSKNPIQDCGVEQLCKGLKSSTCKLETLSLNCCNLTERSGGLLSSVLSSASSLSHLDLSNNRLLDSGLDLLCAGLMSPLCRLEALRLSGCLVSVKGVKVLLPTLSKCHLKELDLTQNNLSHCNDLRTLRSLVHTLRVESVDLGYQAIDCLIKYFCEMSLDPATAHRMIRVSDDGRQAEYELRRFFSFEDFESFQFERFSECPQVLCTSPLTGRCFWEVECWGDVDIAVSYKSIARKGDKKISGFGEDTSSWCLRLSGWSASIIHKGTETTVSYWVEVLFHGIIRRVAVFLDCPNGRLSFFRVSDGNLIHLHSFKTCFTEPLYAGFGFRWDIGGSSVSLVKP